MQVLVEDCRQKTTPQVDNGRDEVACAVKGLEEDKGTAVTPLWATFTKRRLARNARENRSIPSSTDFKRAGGVACLVSPPPPLRIQHGLDGKGLGHSTIADVALV